MRNLQAFTRRPLWYFPEGMDVAPHLSPSWGRAQTRDGKGPDGGQGLVVGGLGDPARDHGWKKTGAGYWVNFAGCSPEPLLRACPLDGVTITGPNPDTRSNDEAAELFWRVPQLWEITASGFQTALDPILGPQGFEIPAAFEEVAGRVREYMLDCHNTQPNDDEKLTQLAADILAVNYHITLEDLRWSGWLSLKMLPQIFVACATGKSLAEVAPEAVR